MEETPGYPCPHCGYNPATAKTSDYGLRQGTILNGKYVVGAILGQGGFGITYVGWDLALDCKVAIKEYYPSGQVVRDNATGSVLHWLSTPQSGAARNMGKEMFLKEARKMTRVRNIPQVVHVHDLFQENDTAYIVMDFVAGETLMSRLKKNGPLSWQDAQAIFFPVIRAMEQVHEASLVHRDLSPDNLMIASDGTVQILDLGAAKDLTINSGASSMQVAKGGFSPLEQYSQRGSSGPWTDVYALAATMYYSLTGVLPPNAVDRVDEDPIRWDFPQLSVLPKGVLPAIQKAMAVTAKARTQSMGEFLAQLEKAQTKRKEKPTPKQKPAPKQKTKKKKSPLPAIAAVLAVALIAGWVLWPRDVSEPQMESRPQAEAPTEAVPETETTIPTEPESVFPLAIQEQTFFLDRDRVVAVCNDGSVVTTGKNNYGQCNVSDWKNIVAVSAGYVHTVGLKADGTVVATGRNECGQCDVSDWTDIVAVSAGGLYTVGLKADGTVVATTRNEFGQYDVSDWTDIVAISVDDDITVGLRADGTVVATGRNDHGQCDVSDWTDIVAVSAGAQRTVGLKSDGTVISAGYSYSASTWSNVVAVASSEVYDGTMNTAGLTADGRLLISWDRFDTSDWTDIRIPGTIQ